MISKNLYREYYQALLEKDADYEGIFFVGVKSTGIFCRPTCPARKPKFENCEWFSTAQEALISSYRPCQRCRPLSHPSQVSAAVSVLVDAIENNPEKRWTDKDLADLSIDASTARRQFKKRFGMTFIAYARARRLGIAFENIRKGATVIDSQLSAGFESGSGFRDAFSRIMGTVPSNSDQCSILKAEWIDTPLGPVLAIANEEALFLLEFVERRALEREIIMLRKKTKSAILPGCNAIIDSIKNELEQYFAGKLTSFKTRINYLGTPFQKLVWDQLREIPYGKTISYGELAESIDKPTASRAVAQANGANQLAIIIPCHRVINANGEVGGYGGGIQRKQWLIQHEAEAVT